MANILPDKRTAAFYAVFTMFFVLAIARFSDSSALLTNQL